MSIVEKELILNGLGFVWVSLDKSPAFQSESDQYNMSSPRLYCTTSSWIGKTGAKIIAESWMPALIDAWERILKWVSAFLPSPCKDIKANR